MAPDFSPLPFEITIRLGELNRELLVWLWDELRTVEPDIDIRATKRYIGLYLSKHDTRTFARVDAQRGGLRIGVERLVVEQIGPGTLSVYPFPDWKKGLVGITLSSHASQIIPILTAAVSYRREGYRALERMKLENVRLARVEKRIQKDIASFEVEISETEGGRRTRYSSYYERKPRKRAEAIAIHGTVCMVSACGFDFEKAYGIRGRDFIEVHHLWPISDGPYATNPRRDMVVVCANCHRMIHRQRDRVLGLEELSQMIQRSLRR